MELEKSKHIVGASSVESGLMPLHTTATSENTEMMPFIRVTNLIEFTKEIVHNLPGEKDASLFDDKIWILFSGDKGGGYMKFHIEVIISISAGSVDNVHLFCMFEGADSLENMWKVFAVYRNPIIAMQEDDFHLDGRKVLVFLGGDFHYLDDMLGHEGSTSTFPSCLDLVTLDHLRKHGGQPHTPSTCNIHLRSIEDYAFNYNENLCDDRSKNNMRENRKYHNSVIEKCYFQ